MLLWTVKPGAMKVGVGVGVGVRIRIRVTVTVTVTVLRTKQGTLKVGRDREGRSMSEATPMWSYAYYQGLA